MSTHDHPTSPARPVLPLPGPLDADPTPVLLELAAEPSRLLTGIPADRRVPALARTMLYGALTSVETGDHDELVLDRLASLASQDAATIATIASLLRRSWEAGAAAGRAERVDEQPIVAHLRATIAELQAGLLNRNTRVEELLASRDAARAEADRLAQALTSIGDATHDVDGRTVRGGDLDPASGLELLVQAVSAAIGGVR